MTERVSLELRPGRKRPLKINTTPRKMLKTAREREKGGEEGMER
jgi:hypothetical protein